MSSIRTQIAFNILQHNFPMIFQNLCYKISNSLACSLCLSLQCPKEISFISTVHLILKKWGSLFPSMVDIAVIMREEFGVGRRQTETIM